MFFASKIGKIGLYANISNENIGYSKLSQNIRYRKLVKSTQEKSNSNEEKICYTRLASIALVNFQKLENISSQEDTLMSGI